MTTNQADLTLGVGVRTEQGRREENQDKMTAFSTPRGMFYIVADGMGGHRGGAEASRRVVEGYQTHLNSAYESTDLAEILQQATAQTNAEILHESRSGDPAVAGMGSTVVMVLLKSTSAGMEMMTAHIGDSRAYLLRGNLLYKLTRDHSAVQRMVDEQLITPEMARTHPDLNVLTRAIGKQPDVVIDVSELSPVYPGDNILLCTDGLWGHLSDEQIVHVLSINRSAQEAADELFQLALDAGSDDNITLQVLRVENRDGIVRQYPPPPMAMSPASFQRGDTMPSAAFSGLPQTESLAAPVSAGKVRRNVPVLLYVTAIVICLLLAACGGYFAYRWAHRTIPSPPKCLASEYSTEVGSCLPKPVPKPKPPAGVSGPAPSSKERLISRPNPPAATSHPVEHVAPIVRVAPPPPNDLNHQLAPPQQTPQPQKTDHHPNQDDDDPGIDWQHSLAPD